MQPGHNSALDRQPGVALSWLQQGTILPTYFLDIKILLLIHGNGVLVHQRGLKFSRAPHPGEGSKLPSFMSMLSPHLYSLGEIARMPLVTQTLGHSIPQHHLGNNLSPWEALQEVEFCTRLYMIQLQLRCLFLEAILITRGVQTGTRTFGA